MADVAVFIDGFNLFYSAKAARAKWLDIPRLVDTLPRSGDTITQIHYFTAMVDGVGDPHRPLRQQLYLRALRLDNRVTVHLGSFLNKTIDRPLERLNIADCTCHWTGGPQLVQPNTYDIVDARGDRRYLPVYDFSSQSIPAPKNPYVFARVHTREEKGSDVNLAAQMLHRAWKNEYEQAIIVSNDSDLCEPIRIVRDELKKNVTICFIPQKRHGTSVSSRLKNSASGVLNLSWSDLRRNQFPDSIQDRQEVIYKPLNW